MGTARGLDPGPLSTYAHFLVRRVADQDRTVVLAGARDRYAFRVGAKGDPFTEWAAFLPKGQWSYGQLSYGLKDHVERLGSRHAPRWSFPLLWWALPERVVEVVGDAAFLYCPASDEAEAKAWAKKVISAPPESAPARLPDEWLRHTDRTAYMEALSRIQRHLLRGDIYELNYCTERTATLPELDPYASFTRLMAGSSASFPAFYRHLDQFALCASPERYLSFDGRLVRGEPMKGTRARSIDAREDARAAAALAADEKERSENVMAVDVMRNDLGRVAVPGSVQVPVLFGIRSHPGVHQMVSTIEARLADGMGPVQAVAASFPMASMTGAPKIRAMQLIDELEDMPRELFSGSLGFFDDRGRGDLNVMIRTVMYDAPTGHASLITGSAITVMSDHEKEYEECELKARSVLDPLRG